MKPPISTTSFYSLALSTETAPPVVGGANGAHEMSGSKTTIFMLTQTGPRRPASPRNTPADQFHLRKMLKPARLATPPAANGDARPRRSIAPVSEARKAPATRQTRIVQRLVTIFSEDQARQIIPIRFQKPTSSKNHTQE